MIISLNRTTSEKYDANVTQKMEYKITQIFTYGYTIWYNLISRI